MKVYAVMKWNALTTQHFFSSVSFHAKKSKKKRKSHKENSIIVRNKERRRTFWSTKNFEHLRRPNWNPTTLLDTPTPGKIQRSRQKPHRTSIQSGIEDLVIATAKNKRFAKTITKIGHTERRIPGHGTSVAWNGSARIARTPGWPFIMTMTIPPLALQTDQRKKEKKNSNKAMSWKRLRRKAQSPEELHTQRSEPGEVHSCISVIP